MKLELEIKLELTINLQRLQPISRQCCQQGSTGRQREGVFWTPQKYEILILRGLSQF